MITYSLICIDEQTDFLKFRRELTCGKEYKILSWSEPSEDGRQFLYIINDSGSYSEYLASRFVTKNKFREIQLEKLGV